LYICYVGPLKDHIQKLREDFTKGSLSEADVHKEPDKLFELWLNHALEAEVPEIQAMTLATVSPAGKPSSRVVYLREFGNDEFIFYGNYNSRKAKHIEKNPNVALNFFWPDLERQIRIEGIAKKVEASISDNYFDQRPYESKLGAWASAQSSELNSREELEKKVEEFRKNYSEDDIKRPDFWGGWIVKASYYEFWQGRKSRLHDRIVYVLEDSLWKIKRLSP
jgi:pyridoxamine 5'-phosphate oxidase